MGLLHGGARGATRATAHRAHRITGRRLCRLRGFRRSGDASPMLQTIVILLAAVVLLIPLSRRAGFGSVLPGRFEISDALE